MTKIQSPT